MSYHYYDRGARGSPQGRPDYNMAPTSGRGSPHGNVRAPDQRRGPSPMRPNRPDALASGPIYTPRHPPQQYSQPRAMETENLYDGSAFGGADDDDEQWPLPARPYAQSGRSNSPGGSPRRPPQRPQRPNSEESLLDPPRPSARIAPANRAYHQGPPPQHYQGAGQWSGNNYGSAQPPMPQPAHRRPPPPLPSQAPIPDFQSPLQQAAAGFRNQRPPLGPPPSSRKGPASYYPQIAPVHPIAEEHESMRGSIRHPSTVAHSSYASSNAIPIGIPNYYLEERDETHESAEPYPRPSLDHVVSPLESRFDPSIDRGYDDDYGSRGSPSPEPAALIRQASLGKKSKPTLTHVKSVDRKKENASTKTPTTPKEIVSPLEKEAFDFRHTRHSASDSDSDDDLREKALEVGGAVAVGATAGALAAQAGPKKTRDNVSTRTGSSDILSSGTGLLDPSSSESEKEIRKVSSKERIKAALGKEKQQPRSQPRSPLAPGTDPRMEKIRTSLERGGALDPADPEELRLPTPGLSERGGGKRRPPKLDVDSVRKAEARGSLTSLPDLINRATRLASNLDRGRTASRLGMNLFDSSDSESEKERRRQSYLKGSSKRESGVSLSDMLASFPPPGLGTPTSGTRDGVRRSYTNWSSNLRHSALPSDSDAGEIRNKDRRCCGIPLWLFLLLLVVLILLIAAAIIVPVVLVVVPRQHANNNSSNAKHNPSHSSTSASNPALASCEQKLMCQNGGANVLSSDGYCRCLCVNGFTGSTCNAQSNTGCTTFTVGSTQASVGDDIPRLLQGAQNNFSVPLQGEELLGLFSAANMSCVSQNALVTFNGAASKRSTPVLLEARGSATSTTDAAATSNSILYASGTPSSSPSTSGNTNSTTLDFARVAVLYILQSSGQASTAIVAQQDLQSYFTSGETSSGTAVTADDVPLGPGYSCDLQSLSLHLSNGTTVGGK